MHKTIQRVLLESRELIDSVKVKPRDYNIKEYVGTDKILVLSGFRRVGKTFLLFDTMKGLKEKEWVYVNFEDERLVNVKLSEIIDQAIELFGDKDFYLFLDEIHNIENWSKFVRRLHDSKRYKIFVSGSSSKLGSKEIPTELRGRNLTFNILPLSFKEFIRFKVVEIKKSSRDLVIKNLFKEYLHDGGFPETINLDLYKKRMITEEYLKTLLERDLIERFDIRREEELKVLVQLLLNSSAITFSKLFNSIKSLGFDISKNTIISYLGYLESSFFLYSCGVYSKKVKDELQHYRKMYFIDNSFINYYSRSKEIEARLLENVVFLELLRRKKEVRYYLTKNKNEIDFLILDNLQPKEIIEVCYSIEDLDIRKKKIRSMLKSLKELGLSKGLILTFDQEEKIKGEGYEILVMPAWKWLLNEN